MCAAKERPTVAPSVVEYGANSMGVVSGATRLDVTSGFGAAEFDNRWNTASVRELHGRSFVPLLVCPVIASGVARNVFAKDVTCTVYSAKY